MTLLSIRPAREIPIVLGSESNIRRNQGWHDIISRGGAFIMRGAAKTSSSTIEADVPLVHTLDERLDNHFPFRWGNSHEVITTAGGQALRRYRFEGRRIIVRRLLAGEVEATIMQATENYNRYVTKEADQYVTQLFNQGNFDPEFIGRVWRSRLVPDDSLVFAPYAPDNGAPQFQQFRTLTTKAVFESITLSETPPARTVSDPHHPH